MTDRKIIAMTNEEFEAVLAEAKKQLALGVELPELLRRLGAVVSAQQPRCPMHKTEMVQKVNGIPFWVCSTDGCDLFISAEIIKQVAQFFAAAPAQPDSDLLARYNRAYSILGEALNLNAEYYGLVEMAQVAANRLTGKYDSAAQERPENNWTVCDKCQKSHIPLENCAQEQPVDNTTKKITDKIMHLLVEALKMRRLPKEADDILLLRGSISTIVSESLAEPTER